MSNEDVCDLVIKVKSSEQTECMYFEALATRNAKMIKMQIVLILVLMISYMWVKILRLFIVVFAFLAVPNTLDSRHSKDATVTWSPSPSCAT